MSTIARQRLPQPGHQQRPPSSSLLLGCCSVAELAAIDASKTTQRYQKGQFIYQEGSQPLGMHCVQQGRVKLSKAASDNKEQIVQLLRAGDAAGYCALVADTRHTHSAVALEDCVVWLVPRPGFLHLMQTNQQFSHAVLQLLAQSLGQAEERMTSLAYKPVRERVAAALLLVQQTFQQEEHAQPFSVALGREDLAALVGTAKETVSRLLSEFKEERIIATRGSQITILKPARLLEIATMYD